ncbi:MAG: RNA polymerase sigma factor [Gemmatimonadales bacterium]
METHDQSLAALARSADPSSLAPADPRWREWYEAHGGAVYGYIRFLVSSPDVAEDLSADTFVKALGASTRFDPSRASPRTWILAIARNVVRDHLRQARRRRQLPFASLRDLASDTPSPEERLLWEEEVRQLLAAVGRLGRADQDLIGLRYGSGLGPAAIAETLGLRPSAVRTRLWRALQRLRQEIE